MMLNVKDKDDPNVHTSSYRLAYVTSLKKINKEFQITISTILAQQVAPPFLNSCQASQKCLKRTNVIRSFQTGQQVATLDEQRHQARARERYRLHGRVRRRRNR